MKDLKIFIIFVCFITAEKVSQTVQKQDDTT